MADEEALEEEASEEESEGKKGGSMKIVILTLPPPLTPAILTDPAAIGAVPARKSLDCETQTPSGGETT